MSTQPRLLLFTLDPDAECSRRRLLPKRLDHLGRRLLRRSLAAALEAGRTAGCRLEVSSPRRLELAQDVTQARQRGDSFGDRFRHALRDARRRSGGALVVVGSDVPGLSASHVARALSALTGAPDRVVLGPSPDGGFYLLASNRSVDEELAEVSWCGSDTLETLKTALEARGREVVLLSPLRDLDRAQELARWLAHEARLVVGWDPLVRALLRALAVLARPTIPRRLGRSSLVPLPVLSGRGPPRA